MPPPPEATASPPPSASRPARPLSVHTVLYDGVGEQDLAGRVGVFGIVGEERITQSSVTADGARPSGIRPACRTTRGARP